MDKEVFVMDTNGDGKYVKIKDVFQYRNKDNDLFDHFD